MESQLVTVIVPIYNAQDTIEACVKSILASTYQKLEVILIDDGSGDESQSVCKGLLQEDARIRLYRQENRGVSAARNLGMQKANGEYVLFVDADDTIDIRMVELLVEYAVSTQADFVIGNENIGDRRCRTGCMAQTAAAKALFRGSLPLNSTAKLWRASLVQNIRFDETLSVAEDTGFLFEALAVSSRIAYVEAAVYCIGRRQGSLSRNWKDTARMERTYEVFEKMERTAANVVPDAVRDIRVRKWNTAAVDLRMLDVGLEDAATKKYLAIIRRNCLQFLAGGMTAKYKLAYLATCISPEFARKAYRLCKRRQ